MRTFPTAPAFAIVTHEETNIPGYMREVPHHGLNKREYFAALAMQGLLMGNPEFGTENTSRWAVKMADALILELNKPGVEP
jgi:hypothetical protein